jgi:DNA-binding transcriptional LysR family regulator
MNSLPRGAASVNTRFLETFLWVARLKSFSAAAERLRTTQAAISNRIATLERELGVRLFERDSQAVNLTLDGEKALKRAAEIVRLTHELRDQVGDGQSLRGSISIGTIDSIVYSWLPDLIAKINCRYPAVSLDLEVDTSLAVSRQLVERQIDLALIVGPVYGDDLVNIELGTLVSGWFASPRLGLNGRTLELAEVLAFPIFGYSRGSHPYHAMMQQLDRAGIDAETVRIFNTNSIATNIRLGTDGIGVAVLPKVAARDYVARGELAELEVKVRVDPLVFHAAFLKRPDNPLPSAIAAMAAEVAASFETRELEML